MEGISGASGLAAAMTDLSTTKATTDTQVTVLKKIIDQAQEQVVPLLEGLGENFHRLA